MNKHKLYIVVRADMPAGVQLAQACHAAIHYALCYHEAARIWTFTGSNLVALAAENEPALTALFDKLPDAVAFREPDQAFKLTAIAVPPSDEARRALSSLPLALREELGEPFRRQPDRDAAAE